MTTMKMNSGKTIIVTGASKGIGAAVAEHLAALGAEVVVTARSRRPLFRVAKTIQGAGGKVLPVTGDVSSREDCEAVVAQTITRFGYIDGLVNNAGILEPLAPLDEADEEAWQRNWAVNVLGPLLMIQAALPYLRQQSGRVVNVSSGAAVRGIAGWGAYCVAKGGLNQLTRVLAEEEPMLTCVALRPGAVDTAMQGVLRQAGKHGMKPEEHQRFVSLYQSGDLLPPQKPARAIAALALAAPLEWSGQFMRWDDETVQALVKQVGEPQPGL